MSKLWRKFRKTGIEQPVLPEAPTGTIISFAGTAPPGGWLTLSNAAFGSISYAGPYLYDDYPELGEIVGWWQRAAETGDSNVYLAAPVMKNRVVIGAYDTAYGVTGPGAVQIDSFSGLNRTYKDYAQGWRDGKASVTLEPYEAAVNTHTHPLGRSHSHGTKNIPNDVTLNQSHQVARSAVTIRYQGQNDETLRSVGAGGNLWTLGGAKHNLSVSSSTINYAFYGHEAAATAAHGNVQPYIDMEYLIKT